MLGWFWVGFGFGCLFVVGLCLIGFGLVWGMFGVGLGLVLGWFGVGFGLVCSSGTI